MEIYKKLQKIKETRYTQEELAILLKVSFPTLNSWINQKSIPRKKHIENINNLYEYIFGLEKIDLNLLKIKEESILKLIDKYLFKDILKNQIILDKLILKITYNTNSIEGSTLTMDDTESIIFNKKTIQNRTIVEHLEAVNHKQAFLFSLELVKKKQLDKDDILMMHKILMSGIIDNAGFFRNHPVRILGSGVVTANYLKINLLMEEFLNHFNKNNDKFITQKIAKSHADFEKIHPFSDGNGRIGRLLMVILTFKNNLPPVIILKNRKKAYYKYLREAQVNENYEFLVDFICDSILVGNDIVWDV